MEHKNTALGVVALALFVAAALWYSGRSAPSEDRVQRALFENSALYFTLNYRQEPNGYVIIPRPASGGAQYVLNMFLYADYQALQAKKYGQEGPPMIALGIYPNPKNQLPWDWVKTNSSSNYALSGDKKVIPESVSGKPAASYRWSGLYESQSVAVSHRGRIYLFSVSSPTSEDQIRKDFEDLLDRAKLE